VAADDFGVIVGIQRYPGFGPTPTQSNDLRGPDRDSAAVIEWLTDPKGGDVPAANVRGFRSATYPDPFLEGKVEPRKGDVIGAFRWLDGIASRHNADMQGMTVGRRLYLYATGHGFGRGRAKAALFMANATAQRRAHLEASAWADWLYRATYFEEYVIWMDCCMNAQARIPAEEVGFRDVVPLDSPKLFAGFAARFPHLAVEARMDDGLIHGAFTWALLQGLRGAAADIPTGEVRTAGLRDYLTNVMGSFMTDEQRADPDVSNEPDFGFDDDILFAKVDPALAEIHLTFAPAATGAAWHVLTGSPATDVGDGTVGADGAGITSGGATSLWLPTGVYIARIDALGVTTGFEVSGSDQVVHVA
jgi:hypothetical protein